MVTTFFQMGPYEGPIFSFNLHVLPHVLPQLSLRLNKHSMPFFDIGFFGGGVACRGDKGRDHLVVACFAQPW